MLTDFDAVVQRQIRVMWIGAVWFLAAFMPFFLLPWHWSAGNLVALGLLLMGGAAAVQGARVATASAPLWRHLFLTVPAVLLLASLALSGWMAGR